MAQIRLDLLLREAISPLLPPSVNVCACVSVWACIFVMPVCDIMKEISAPAVHHVLLILICKQITVITRESKQHQEQSYYIFLR